MATIKKNYAGNSGLNLRESDIARGDEFASEIKNGQLDKEGSIEKRDGFILWNDQRNNTGSGDLKYTGLHKYNYTDESNQIVSELLVSDKDLFRVVTAFNEIQYVGVGASCLFTFEFDEVAETYRVRIVEDGLDIYNRDVLKSSEEVGADTVATIRLEITALPEFTLITAASGDSTVNVHNSELVSNFEMVGANLQWNHRKLDRVSGYSNIFLDKLNEMNTDEFEPLRSVNLNNNLYFPSNSSGLVKYDAQNVYRAGLPTMGTLPVPTLPGVGSGPTGTYFYGARYSRLDNSGNRIYGNILSVPGATVTAAAEAIDVLLGTDLSNDTAYYAKPGTILNTGVSTTTLTLDYGGADPFLSVGDTIYFTHNGTSRRSAKIITVNGAKSYTIAGGNVTVLAPTADKPENDWWSLDVRIELYRNKNGGINLFLVDEFPVPPKGLATPKYRDNKGDGDLGIQFIPPLKEPSIPPLLSKYLAVWDGQMVIAGMTDTPDLAFYEDTEILESFPALNFVKTYSDRGDIITGLGSTKNIYLVFKQRSIDLLTGILATDNITQETITTEIGCASHASIAELRSEVFFLSDKGVYSINSSAPPTDIGFPVEPLITKYGSSDKLRLKGAVGAVDHSGERYLLSIPDQDDLSGERYASDNSITLALDYRNRAWFKWSNCTGYSGMVEFGDDIYFINRVSYLGSVASRLHKFITSDDSTTYFDYFVPTSFEWYTGWNTMGDASVFKKFIRNKIFSTNKGLYGAFDLTVVGQTNFEKTDKFQFDLVVAELFRKHKINIKAQALRLGYKNNTFKQNVKIQGWEIEMDAPYAQEIKD